MLSSLDGEKSRYLEKLRQLDQFVAVLCGVIGSDTGGTRALMRRVIRFCREFGGLDRVQDALDANELLEDAAKAFGIIGKIEAERDEAEQR